MGLLYIVQMGTLDIYKIGITDLAIETRLSAIQVGNPLKLTVSYLHEHDSPRKLESHLHRELKHYRLEGEWFSVDIDTIKYTISSYIEQDLLRLAEAQIKVAAQLQIRETYEDRMTKKALNLIDNGIIKKKQLMSALGITSGDVYKKISPIVDQLLDQQKEVSMEDDT